MKLVTYRSERRASVWAPSPPMDGAVLPLARRRHEHPDRDRVPRRPPLRRRGGGARRRCGCPLAEVELLGPHPPPPAGRGRAWA